MVALGRTTYRIIPGKENDAVCADPGQVVLTSLFMFGEPFSGVFTSYRGRFSFGLLPNPAYATGDDIWFAPAEKPAGA